MKKTPNLFIRHFAGDRKLVTREINPAARWVFDGLGVPTEKIDGTACMIDQESRFYKRYEVKKGKTPPEGFLPADDVDEITGKQPGWVLVGDGPEDQYHQEGFRELASRVAVRSGTYELVGPKVQGNPYGYALHKLIPHTVEALTLTDQPARTYEGLRDYLALYRMEGIVYHHPDGRRAKIKRTDLGLEWP